MQTFFIAPTDFGVGLTSISLGLVRTLERAGLKVGFFKPIAQPHPGDTGPERSTELVARTHGLKPPQPLGLAHVERMLGDGQLDELLEEIITLYQQAAIGKDVLVVEGMVPTRSASYAARVNLHLAKSLDAEVILVSAPENEVLTELSGRGVGMDVVQSAAQALGAALHAQRAADVDIIGPVPCFYQRVNGMHRWQIVLRGAQPAALLDVALPAGWRVEVDPVSLL